MILALSFFAALSLPSVVRAQTPPPAVRTGNGDMAQLDAALARQSPGDAPRVGAGRLNATPPPPGFNVFDGGWIRFYYHPSSREHVQALIAESTVVRRELAEKLGSAVLPHVRVDVARTPGEMATFAPADAPYPEYAAGVAYPEIGLVLLSLSPVHPTSDHNLVQVFRHELAHVALFDAVAGRHVPRWFNEGFAVFSSGESSFDRLRTLWMASVADTLPPLSQLEESFPANEGEADIAYAEAVDVVRYLVRKREHFRFQGLVERVRAGEDFASSLKDAYGVDLPLLEQEWREDVARRYTFWPVLLSGSFVWFGVMGLFVLGWRKKRQRAKVTLTRWAEEEAREDQARLIEARAPRVHIVLARNNLPPGMPPMPPPEAEVPKVEHDGQWHTLH
ncbi:MAG: peptidase MA family metallohydrolase [Polyangiaceae bacterium]